MRLNFTNSSRILHTSVHIHTYHWLYLQPSNENICKTGDLGSHSVSYLYIPLTMLWVKAIELDNKSVSAVDLNTHVFLT